MLTFWDLSHQNQKPNKMHHLLSSLLLVVLKKKSLFSLVFFSARMLEHSETSLYCINECNQSVGHVLTDSTSKLPCIYC